MRQKALRREKKAFRESDGGTECVSMHGNFLRTQTRQDHFRNKNRHLLKIITMYFHLSPSLNGKIEGLGGKVGEIKN